MQETQQEIILKDKYFEVFNKNKDVRYGFTSKQDMEKIEKKYPNKYEFKEYDYIDLEKLEDRSKIQLTFASFEKLSMVLIISTTILAIISSILLLLHG